MKISRFSLFILEVIAGYSREREDTHVLRLKSELFDLRSGYVNRILLHLRLAEPVQIQSLHIQRKEKRHSHTGCRFSLEVQAGFEPADNGVADRGLTTWLLHQKINCLNIITKFSDFVKGIKNNLSKEFKFFL